MDTADDRAPGDVSDIPSSPGSPRIIFRVPQQVYDELKAEAARRHVTMTTLMWERLGLFKTYVPPVITAEDPPVISEFPSVVNPAVCKHPSERRNHAMLGMLWKCKDCGYEKN